jgi:acyl-CoA thioester hydrolase
MIPPLPPGATVRTVRLRVRYDEVDGMGVIHHPNFLIYFEIGRTEYMRASGLSYAEMERRGFLLVVTEAAARYHANVRYDDEVLVKTAIASIGRATIRFAYAIEDAKGRLLCEGTTEHCCVRPDLARPIRLPPEVTALPR